MAGTEKIKTRILVISRGPWNSNNNTGNTLENLFGERDDLYIYNLYMRSEAPGKNPCKAIYQISEKQLLDSIVRHSICGKELTEIANSHEEAMERRIYGMAKKINSYLLWFGREVLWELGKWKNGNLDKYLEKVSPDIIFMPVFGCWYPHKMLNYVKRKTAAKIILYHADDNYTLQQFHFSPVYWLYRFGLRRWIRKSVAISDINYCISTIQKKDYESIFNVPFYILQKTGQFDGDFPEEKKLSNPIQLVYTGNISSGRYKTLAAIGKALDEINTNGIKAQLIIYTSSSMTSKMHRYLSRDSITMMGSVPAEEIKKIQTYADILVHVESFSLKDKWEVRQSFSTKIVDYLERGRCVLAVGPKDVASVQYFVENDAGYVISDKQIITSSIDKLLTDETLIMSYARKAWGCGKRKHSEQRDIIKEVMHENINC